MVFYKGRPSSLFFSLFSSLSLSLCLTFLFTSDIAKSAKDLFKKGYDYKNEVKVVSESSGVKVESGGYQAKGICGYTKVCSV
jgi:hypothetical protein